MNSNDRKTKSGTSGPGAAHTSYRMFAARGIFLAPEDGGGGGGAGGGTAASSAGAGSTGASTGGETAGTPPPAGAKPVFTPEQQAEVNRIAARAREEGRTSATPPPKKDQAAASTATGAEASTDVSELRREMNFREAASDLGVPRDQRNDLFTWAKALGVSDFGQFLESKRAMWATPQQQAQTQQTNPNGTTQDQARGLAAPASSAGNKVDPITSGGLVDFWHMTPAQLEQLGASGVRREYEKHLAEGSRRNGAPPIPKVMQKK